MEKQVYHTCARFFAHLQYVNRHGLQEYGSSYGPALQLVAKLGWFLNAVGPPDDGLAFQKLMIALDCQPGSKASPRQLMGILLGHSMKVPGAVLHLAEQVKGDALDSPEEWTCAWCENININSKQMLEQIEGEPALARPRKYVNREDSKEGSEKHSSEKRIAYMIQII